MKINLGYEIKTNLDNVKDGDVLIIQLGTSQIPILYKEDDEDELFFVIGLNSKFVKSYTIDTSLYSVFTSWNWRLCDIISSEQIEIKKITKEEKQ